jgi:hypothetical protein
VGALGESIRGWGKMTSTEKEVTKRVELHFMGSTRPLLNLLRSRPAQQKRGVVPNVLSSEPVAGVDFGSWIEGVLSIWRIAEHALRPGSVYVPLHLIILPSIHIWSFSIFIYSSIWPFPKVTLTF